MDDIYAEMAVVADELLTEFKQGTVTLTRTADTATLIDAEAPWLGYVVSTNVYELRATVTSVYANQATAKFIDGTTIRATDQVVVAGPKAIHTLTGGVAADGAEVDVSSLSPGPGSVITIDGKPVTVQHYVQVTGAGTAIVHRFIVRG